MPIINGSILTETAGGKFKSPLLGSIPLALINALALDSTSLDV